MARISLPDQFFIPCHIILTAMLFCSWSMELQSAENNADNLSSQFEIDIKTKKKIASAKEFLSQEEWGESFSILNELIQSRQNELVQINDQQYLNLRKYCHILISQLPPEGLQVYRDLVDQNIQYWHDQARGNKEPSTYRKILQNGYASSYGDDALFSLGELAWSKGKISLARFYWSQLIPPVRNNAGEDSRLILRYPDTNRNRADILARLLLCSLVEGDRSRAKQELQAFVHLYSNARGTLAGRSGNLAKILTAKMTESESWAIDKKNKTVATFGVNIRRSGDGLESMDMGQKLFSFPLSGALSERKNGAPTSLSFHPVTFDNKLFINNELDIFGWDLKTGHPAWSNDPNDSAVIYSSNMTKKEIQPTHSVEGTPQFTLTIDDGYLYARMGTTVLNQSRKELRELQSEIACLNLKEAEGKLEWIISSRDFGKSSVFEGSPIIKNGRGYATIRQSGSDPSIQILCFDKKSGQSIWLQSISSLIRPLTGLKTVLGHQLLSADESSLYYQIPDIGLVSLSQENGHLNWIYLFPKRSLASNGMISPYLLPPVISNNQVFLVDRYNQSILALDSDTGFLIWKKQVNDQIRHLIGVDQRCLIISGKKLFGLNLFNGSLEWQIGYENPIGYTHGRGMIAGHMVYWPTVEELILVDTRTGKIRHRNHLTQLHGIHGGNLLISDNRIAISGQNHISVFSPFGKNQKKRSEDRTISFIKSGSPF